MRTGWLRVHRWFALSVSWLLAIIATLGAIHVVARPLDELQHPELFVAVGDPSSAQAPVPLEAVRRQFVAVSGHDADLRLRPPRETRRRRDHQTRFVRPSE